MVRAACCLLVALAAGCRTRELRPHPDAIARPQLTARPPAEPATVGRPAKAVLALTGGGSYGAFSAGVLTGWSRSNTRPEFDVVTGVSTGSLLAPLAFLGPDYDRLMRRFYTEVGQADIFTLRHWAEVPFCASAATNQPLRDILDYGLTPAVIDAIADEHRKGRRLYVATTQLDTRRTVVWDLGAVAGRPNGRAVLIDILLASCAVPGVFPPIALPGGDGKPEWHVDGGVTAPVFVPPAVFETAAPGCEVFVLVAGKFYPDAAPVKPRVLRVLGASGVALMHAHTRHDVANVYHMARVSGVAFRVAALRPDFPAVDNGIEFDTHSMGRMFVEGVKVGLSGPTFANAPPERSPGDLGIRTGVVQNPDR